MGKANTRGEGEKNKLAGYKAVTTLEAGGSEDRNISNRETIVVDESLTMLWPSTHPFRHQATHLSFTARLTWHVDVHALAYLRVASLNPDGDGREIRGGTEPRSNVFKR